MDVATLKAESKSHKKSKKEKKEKKHKKSKKRKNHKKKVRESSSSSSSSDSGESGSEWVEKAPEQGKDSKPELTSAMSSSSAPERDEWMTAPSLFACVTRDQLRAAKQPTEKQKQQEAAKYMLDRPGQTGRELNPYWANGGTGLPSEKPPEPESLSLNSTTVGDQGVTWLRRALQRAREQAEESGRSLEEVAAERWGSLSKLEELLSEAEGRKVSLSRAKPDDRRWASERGDRFNRKSGDYGKERREEKRRPNDRDHDLERDERFGGTERIGGNREHGRKPNFSRPDDRNDNRDYRQKPNFSRPDDESTSSSSSKHGKEDSEARNDDRRQRTRLYGDNESYDRYRQSSSEGKSRLSFKKPGESEDLKSSSDYRYSHGSSGSRSWRKKCSSPVSNVSEHSESFTARKEKVKSPSPRRSSSESEPESAPPVQEPEVLSDHQLNELAAKLVKAEILGNDELAAQLKKKLELARQVRATNPKPVATGSRSIKSEQEVVVLTRTDSKGFARPLQTKSAHPEPVGGRRKKEKAETHGADGQRVRYFADDDKYSLQDMFQQEKLTTVEDQNEMFTKLAGKDGRQEHDLDMDDIFSERARQKDSDGKIEARERGRAIQEHKRKEKMLDSCKWCFDGKELQRHLIVAVGAKSYVCLPPYQSLTEGHCLIIPLHHNTCSTMLDEDVWEEIQDFRKALVRMFAADDEDCVLFESAMYLNKFPHMVLHCVPLPRETGDMAPIYFKKAILECETEWSTNKKLVDLSKKNIRHSVPKGLPYFAVDFGNEGGFAHVIEEEKYFPPNFAQEIIGGMLDLDHNMWRKPRIENFDKQRRKVVDFSKKWRDFDFTKKTNEAKRMKTDNSSSSESSP